MKIIGRILALVADLIVWSIGIMLFVQLDHLIVKAVGTLLFTALLVVRLLPRGANR